MRLSNRNNKIQTTARPQSPQVAGIIQTYAGANAPNGWAICDGAVLEQADYPDLFAALGSTWDSFAHPVDGTPTVGASQFALPNLKGLYLAGAGDAGGDARTLGVFQDDGTSKNGLSVSGGTASGTFASSSHSHQYDGRGAKNFQSGNGLAFTLGGSILQPGQNYATNSPSSTASVSSTPASINNGDSETRPKTAPITYIIKLYSDTTSAVSVGINEATATEPGVVKVLEGAPEFASGLYTPTVSNFTNVAQTDINTISYIKVGDTVTIAGTGTVRSSVNGGAEIRLSLPFQPAPDTAIGGGSGTYDFAANARNPLYLIPRPSKQVGLIITGSSNSSVLRTFSFTFTYSLL